jgi:uncharacterized membrane protein
MTPLYSEIKAGTLPKAGGPRAGATGAVIAAVLALTPGPSAAEFKVCNQTLSLYNIAIGTGSEGEYQTEGWWTLSANDCVSPIAEDLASRYVYVFATNIYGDDALSGSTSMCIDRRAHFTITGTDNCWLRGYEEVRFKEVDTRSSTSWTVFIRENQH